jgi:hypothetical protein
MEQSDYDELFGVPSARGVGLEMLEYWLNKEFWDFNRGYCQFDGASEGHCILAGIDPENSMQTIDQYGPAFLPDSIEFYGYSRITAENEWHLKDAVDRRISELKSLGLKGRVHCHEALEKCVKFKLDPPWLAAANNDFECAKRIPAKLRTNIEIIKRISRTASSKGGLKRASKNAVTELLNTVGRKEFEKLEAKGFPNCWTKSSNRLVATDIADLVYPALCEAAEELGVEPPELPSIADRVGQWLKNSAK